MRHLNSSQQGNLEVDVEMLLSLIFTSLGLLLSVTCDNSTSTIEMNLQSNYLQKYEKSSINYTTCEGSEAHDSPEDKDNEKGERCYYTH